MNPNHPVFELLDEALSAAESMAKAAASLDEQRQQLEAQVARLSAPRPAPARDLTRHTKLAEHLVQSGIISGMDLRKAASMLADNERLLDLVERLTAAPPEDGSPVKAAGQHNSPGTKRYVDHDGWLSWVKMPA